MLRHIVLLTLRPDAPAGRADEIVRALGELPAEIPELRAYTVGTDLGLAPGSSTIGIVADFDDEDGWRAYTDHPAHQQIIRDLIMPVRAGRAAAQIRI